MLPRVITTLLLTVLPRRCHPVAKPVLTMLPTEKKLASMVALLACRGGVRTFTAACGWRTSLACFVGTLAAVPAAMAMLAHRRIAFSGLWSARWWFRFQAVVDSLASSAPIILTLAMCGPRERYGEFSFGGGVTSLVIGVAGAGFAATAGAL